MQKQKSSLVKSKRTKLFWYLPGFSLFVFWLGFLGNVVMLILSPSANLQVNEVKAADEANFRQYNPANDQIRLEEALTQMQNRNALLDRGSYASTIKGAMTTEPNSVYIIEDAKGRINAAGVIEKNPDGSIFLRYLEGNGGGGNFLKEAYKLGNKLILKATPKSAPFYRKLNGCTSDGRLFSWGPNNPPALATTEAALIAELEYYKSLNLGANRVGSISPVRGFRNTGTLIDLLFITDAAINLQRQVEQNHRFTGKENPLLNLWQQLNQNLDCAMFGHCGEYS